MRLSSQKSLSLINLYCSQKDGKVIFKNLTIILMGSIMVSGCLSGGAPERPRDVADVSSSDTSTIIDPKIVKS